MDVQVRANGRIIAMRRVWAIGAIVWTAFILSITLSPAQPTDGGWVRDSLAWLTERGLPAWVTYDVVEFAANVVLFVPFGAFLALALPMRILWPTILGLALSLAIEFSQAVFLPARFATVSDIVANAAGAFLGAFLGASSLAIRRRRETPVR